MLRYTPRQARDLSGITAETLRYWRNALKPIKKYKGHGPAFTFGDVLALKVIERLVREFGIQIAFISPMAESLFEGCNRRSWSRADKQFAVLDVESKAINFLCSPIDASLTGPSIVIPLGRIVEDLNHQLTADTRPQDQREFPFDQAVEMRSL